MSNPFKYGGIVSASSFCNRERELGDLMRAMANGDRLFLYSERRLGKTSLVKLALSRLPTDEFLRAPGEIARRRQRKVVLVFDEFQRILEYGSDTAERTLRSAIRDQEGVSFIFLGSRKHLIRRMFLDQDRPLYRAGGHYPLGTIDESAWRPFIKSRFVASGRHITDDVIGTVCEKTGGHPFYTQHLCHAVWELCASETTADAATVDRAVKLLLDRESYAYSSLWDSFTLNQRRFLAGIAHVNAASGVFGSAFIRKNDLSSPSAVQRVVESLLDRDVIDKQDGTYFMADRFFQLWVREMAG